MKPIKKKKEEPIKLVKDLINPEPVEIIAKSIIQISDGFEALLKAGLTKECLVVLLHNQIGKTINKGSIYSVLNALPLLKRTYCQAK